VQTAHGQRNGPLCRGKSKDQALNPAHSQDCWDFEIQSSYGWIECVGCADRSAYDLTVHSVKTKQPLRVQVKLDEPRTVEKLECAFNAKDFGIKFKKDATMIKESLMGLDRERLQCVKDELDSAG
jgi:glycyl-tRNA synthetase